jgi:hypothetical protein
LKRKFQQKGNSRCLRKYFSSLNFSLGAPLIDDDCKVPPVSLVVSHLRSSAMNTAMSMTHIGTILENLTLSCQKHHNFLGSPKELKIKSKLKKKSIIQREIDSSQMSW